MTSESQPVLPAPASKLQSENPHRVSYSMASSKNSKTEKKNKVAESSKTASKASKPRKEEHLEKKKKKNKPTNRNMKEDKLLIVPSSSTESHDEEEDEKVREEDKTEITNGRTSGTKPKRGKRMKDDDEDEDEAERKEDAKTNVFPMNRIRTIIRGQDPDLRVSQEAIFVINKATEKFLEQFTQDAYASCVRDRKKSLSYKHTSSVVSKQRRYEFLSDFVPEKLKAEDALRERNSGVNGG